MLSDQPMIAYFSMEVGFDPKIPTYSGGLGVLAGDLLRSAADIGTAIVGVTLVYRKGYFDQRLDAAGNQTEKACSWSPESVLAPVDVRTVIQMDGEAVHIRCWTFSIRGVNGHEVPLYLLDTDVPENTSWQRSLTDSLYGGDSRYRICQEAILGLGGVGILDELGLDIGTYHMNEGHSAFLTLALLRRENGANPEEAIEAVRRRCVFTTHTPVPAGHDQFPLDLASRVLGTERVDMLKRTRCTINGNVNMTYLALNCSRYINGVAMRHGETSRGMFPEHPIDAITNGVHAVTWTSPAFRDLYDRCIPEWRHDNFYLRYALDIPVHEIQQAHREAKRALIAHVAELTGISLEGDVFTIGFARRSTAYKRAELIFSELDRLRAIIRTVGPINFIFSGKAHPRDGGGKTIIHRIFESAAALDDVARVVYLENYDMSIAHRVCAGVDLWLNTPERPLEASGTSGMKAALNGVPSLSVRDGWWIEGHVEGVTGWSFGEETKPQDTVSEIESLYDKLQHVVLPLYYGNPRGYAGVRRSTIALNGSFFTTQRMFSQYVMNAYRIEMPL